MKTESLIFFPENLVTYVKFLYIYCMFITSELNLHINKPVMAIYQILINLYKQWPS